MLLKQLTMWWYMSIHTFSDSISQPPKSNSEIGSHSESTD
jgi:hypothetical protein